jgi:hypothetical protein
MTATGVSRETTWNNTSSNSGGCESGIEDNSGHTSGSVSYSNEYRSDQVNSDTDVLLDQWHLLDDIEYPWRSDGDVTSGPLVTLNERGASAPEAVFALLNIGTEMAPVWKLPTDTSLPPWPSQPDGTVLGAPLQVHGTYGELYAYQPYYNFYHKNWTFEDTGRGSPQGFIDSYGAPSPYPNATQWLDKDEARCFPAGPFWAYGSEIESLDHFMFRLKDPYITSTDNEWEQGGYGGGCLIKCKWAETISPVLPQGEDFAFKQWHYNFRDFISSFYWNAGAWDRNNIEIPGGSTCTPLSFVTPVRYTPFIIPVGQPWAGYYIGRGSWYLSQMDCTALHPGSQCCQTAVYVEPNAPSTTCNNGVSDGVFVAMPAAVCDARFGSLWMGRVDQSTPNANSCDNYVANLNNGIANPQECGPQIDLEPIFHTSNGAYELWVQPLGFTVGGGPPSWVDLDIDSDNNNGFNPPDRSAFEDEIEDTPVLPGDPGLPGKIVAVNDKDLDNDTIPGFADGFNQSGDGNPSNPDYVSANDKFVPLVLEISSGVDISKARITITYSDSDPQAVWFDPGTSTWYPGSGNLRIWKKDGSQHRKPTSATASGDYVPSGTYSDLTKLGFSSGNRIVTFYVEGIQPSPEQASSAQINQRRILVALDPDGTGTARIVSDSVRVTAFRVNIDIARKNGSLVPEQLEESNGSIVTIAPEVNPDDTGIFLNIPKLGVEPTDVASSLTLKLKKVGPASNQGKIRVYRKGPQDNTYALYLDEDDQEQGVLTSDLTAANWRLDSTMGGVVDLALVAEMPAGTEIGRDTIRISSTPADPAPGRIVFVNPLSSSPAPPYDNFSRNAAHTIADAVQSMSPDANIVIPGGTYLEGGIAIPWGGVIAGLAGQWLVDDPTDPWAAPSPLSDWFDFSSLPVLNNSSLIGRPVFQAVNPATSPDGYLAFAGLLFMDCHADYANANVGYAGAAIHLENIDLLTLSVDISFCRFATNSAHDFGGAIYLSEVSDIFIACCEFETNTVNCPTSSGNQYDRGMGGAIASIESKLEIQDCSFHQNSAQVFGIDPATQEHILPPLGSAGGGGDIYARNRSLTITGCRSENAVAGFPMPAPIQGAPTQGEYFTGDGGSVLIHGETDVGAVIEISDCSFVGPRAYGNGGAISISYDSSPTGRQYIDHNPTHFFPTALSGNCSGQIANTTFTAARGAWQGGAVSINGRLTLLTLGGCHFTDALAGEFATQGKGGAVAVCGGIQTYSDSQNMNILDDCHILACDASANGGGLYCTIRGYLLLRNGTTVAGCTAQNAGGDAQKSGQGGGIHCSAGGIVELSGAELSDNTANGNGGGLSVKSATAKLPGTVSIVRNHALGVNEEATWGNGGGIYITTGRHDSFEGAVAYLYQNDGTLLSTSPTVTLSQNTAARWGGGLYVGWPVDGERVGATAEFELANVTMNHASQSITYGGVTLLPSQIVTEQATNDDCAVVIEGSPPECNFRAALDFTVTIITGDAPTFPDIGTYQLKSAALGGDPIYTAGSLSQNLLVQP